MAQTWEQAVASRDFTTVESWYAANTGHEALGYTVEDLTPGSLESTHDGQVIEGIVGSHIRIGHNNVTYRGCRVENGALYGAYFNPTFGANLTGTVIEYCTIRWEGPPQTDSTLGMILFPAIGGTHVVRNCNVWGWPGSACRPGHGVTMEYSWVHDLNRFEGIHHTSARIRGSDAGVRRCYMTDGSSGVCNAYFDIEMHNVTIEENILNGSSPNATPSYLINLGTQGWDDTATGVRVVGNMFGPEFQFGALNGNDVRWGVDGNELSGNIWFLTGEPAIGD